MSAATLAERKARFVATWKCSICQELPVHPFQPVCGHCLCHDCAKKLSHNKRQCPTCKADIPTITKQPQLKGLVDEFAAMLWPDTWGLFRALSDIEDSPERFNAAAAFVGAATEDQLASLRVLRLTVRLETPMKDWTPAELLSMNPLIEVEAGADGPGVWSGPAVWLESVLASEDVSLRTKARFSLSPACHGVHAAFASRLIPLYAKAAATRPSNGDLLRSYAAFVEQHIETYPGGWEAFAALDGAYWIAPPKAGAAAFQATPSASLLAMVADSISDNVLIPDDWEAPQAIRCITSHVSTGLQLLRASGALSPDVATALLQFIGNVGGVLEGVDALRCWGRRGSSPRFFLERKCHSIQ